MAAVWVFVSAEKRARFSKHEMFAQTHGTKRFLQLNFSLKLARHGYSAESIMLKENICLGLAFAGVVAVFVSAAICSGIVFVCGMAAIMGSMATLA